MKPHAYITVGLGFGDEGKGGMVDFLARCHGATLVVRYSGASQCGHHVVLSYGRYHCFAQLGAASFIPGVKTYLSKYMLIDPLNLLIERDVFNRNMVGDIVDRLYIDPDCEIITPYHVALNRLRELHRGDDRHGSCGMGVGELRAMQLSGKVASIKCRDTYSLHWKLKEIQDYCIAEAEQLVGDAADLNILKNVTASVLVQEYTKFWCLVNNKQDLDIRRSLAREVSIFEGAQGILLDEKWGYAPYNTWTDVTPANALAMISDSIESTVIGVTRTYMTRHGHGPFITEDKDQKPILGEHNQLSPWQGAFRVGRMDIVALRYAMRAAGRIDEIALTHCDTVGDIYRYCYGYEAPDESYVREINTTSAEDIIELQPYYNEAKVSEYGNIENLFAQLSNKTVRYSSYGPTEKDKFILKNGKRVSWSSNKNADTNVATSMNS